jgi:pilus assembly protein CpaD
MMTRSTIRLNRKAACLSVLTATLLAAGLGACARKAAETTGSISAPTDYRERHPVVLKNAPRSLDVFVGRAGSGLDPRQTADVADFGAGYRAQGRGALMVQVPSGTGRDGAAQRTLASVRTLLSQQGVPASALAVSSYPALDPELAAPIRLTFASLQAKVPHDCGQWPDDLGATHTSNWRTNDPYWKLGCATQSTLAAQIADPVDLVRGRAEGTLDTTKRMKAIDKFRDGKDPSTDYRVQPSSINKAVGAQ